MRLPRLPLLIASVLVLVLSLAAGATAAQAPETPPAASGAPEHQHAKHMTLAERFAKANTTNDGHLTLEQARAGLKSVARHFTAIDKDKKGYVTLSDIQSYMKEQRAMRHQTTTNGNG
jgi:hypothetical protein